MEGKKMIGFKKWQGKHSVAKNLLGKKDSPKSIDSKSTQGETVSLVGAYELNEELRSVGIGPSERIVPNEGELMEDVLMDVSSDESEGGSSDNDNSNAAKKSKDSKTVPKV